MKWTLTTGLAFTLGVLISALVCREIRRANRVAYMSDVAAPTAQIVSEINADIQGGATNRAIKRLRLLETRLTEFLHGGRTPEVFVNDIRQV